KRRRRRRRPTSPTANKLSRESAACGFAPGTRGCKAASGEPPPELIHPRGGPGRLARRPPEKALPANMKHLSRRIFWCLAPVVAGLLIIGIAFWNHTQEPLTIFGKPVLTGLKPKLGVDLVGGTILVYEIDPDKKPENYNKEQLVAALKRRLDPAD